jgi:hypothetical protein
MQPPIPDNFQRNRNEWNCSKTSIVRTQNFHREQHTTPGQEHFTTPESLEHNGCLDRLLQINYGSTFF